MTSPLSIQATNPSGLAVSVFGIGYVGAVAAACLARDGHTVVATDVNAEKVRLLAAGRSPIVEPDLDALIAAGAASRRLLATSDASEAIGQTEISLVCVGTPADVHGTQDLSFLRRAADEIGMVLANKPQFHSVVVRSTILPGTMENVVIPALEAASGKRAGLDFGIGYFPEFLREGTAIADNDAPGLVVFGATDRRTEQLLRILTARAGVEPRTMSLAAAEAVKFANNAWHAVKIAFANEIGRVSKAAGLDSHDVMEALCADTKLNLSAAYLTPGYAFGGSCLPKDVNALRHCARTLNVETPLLNAVMQGNQLQIDHAYSAIAAADCRRVGMIGLSFKPETDDLRSSPFVELAERLIGTGYDVRIFDPIVRLSRLSGANQAFVSKRLPHIAQILLEEPGAILDHSELVVIGNKPAATPLLRRLRERRIPILDLVRVDRARRTATGYEGIAW